MDPSQTHSIASGGQQQQSGQQLQQTGQQAGRQQPVYDISQNGHYGESVRSPTTLVLAASKLSFPRHVSGRRLHSRKIRSVFQVGEGLK